MIEIECEGECELHQEQPAAPASGDLARKPLVQSLPMPMPTALAFDPIARDYGTMVFADHRHRGCQA